MRSIYLGLITLMTALNLGCTKGAPNFASLGADNIPMPMFSGRTETSLTATSSTETFAISGDCDSKIRDITGQANGTATAFSSLAAMAASGVSVDCGATGHFSFTLKSLLDLGYTPVNGKTYDIQLRAVTSAGTSNPSTIHITYAAGGVPFTITSGGTASSSVERVATGSAFKAEIRIGHQINNGVQGTADGMTLKTGTKFQMRAGISARE